METRGLLPPLPGPVDGAHLQVVLDSLEVVHEETLRVRQDEGQQEGQGAGDQQKALGHRCLVWGETTRLSE